MVEEINFNGKTAYKCEICHLHYKDRNWAEKCQIWCKKYKSCNLEITKHAIKLRK